MSVNILLYLFNLFNFEIAIHIAIHIYERHAYIPINELKLCD